MDSVPLIPKPKVLPNVDSLPIIRELFQAEFESALSHGSSKKLSKTILTSLQNKKTTAEEQGRESFRSVESMDVDALKRENLLSYSETIFQAYSDHEKQLESVLEAEKNVFDANVDYLKRRAVILNDKELKDHFVLKRYPPMKALDLKHVEKFKLLESDASLPPSYQARSDFRVQDFEKWKSGLESVGAENLLLDDYVKRAPEALAEIEPQQPCLTLKQDKFSGETPKPRKPRPKKTKSKTETEIFRAEPKIVFFTDYNLGEVYAADIEVKNTYTKGMQFQIKPTSPDGPFFVYLKSKLTSKKLFPGLSFQLTVEFSPKSLDVVAEDIYIAIEDGKKLLIPLVAYLEPPILKTHKDINEFTKSTIEKIASSFIECGACFTGDTKVTKLRLKCFRGSGEFFIMSSENWNRTCVNSVTNENVLEITPFRVYPVFFKVEKGEVIDLFVEFTPKNSGTHVENIVVACDNGEVRTMDLIGDAIGWHSYFFSFQDDMLKDLPVDKDDDAKVKYYLDFEDTTPSGCVEKNFAISNNSEMPFEFQWKIREANIMSVQNKYLKLGKFQVTIKPENGTIQPNSICEFTVKITFDNAEMGNYRMVLSLYVLNLPYQCIEEDNTIIQPTGLVRNLYSQSLYGEEEFTTSSPELLSLQGTYESLQDSIKSYVEYQSKAQSFPKYDFCKTTCIPNPGLCAKPLKKSKTYFNIGDEEGLSCICRGRTEETNSDSCVSNLNDKLTELTGPRNEVIWDFVDILVDEVELWVEVCPVTVTMEPAVLDFSNSVVVNNTSMFKQVRISNHCRSSVRCRWLKQQKDPVNSDQSRVSIIFENDSDSTWKSEKNATKIRENGYRSDEDTTTNPSEKQKNDDDDGSEPEFTIPGRETRACSIGVSARKPGKFNEVLLLKVHDSDLELKLIIQGTAIGKYFCTAPQILNFKLVKQGTRYSREYEIRNDYVDPLFLEINQFHFGLAESKYDGETKEFQLENRNTEKFWLEKNQTATKMHYLDGRVPGIVFSLLEIHAIKPVIHPFSNQYVLILGNVRIPSLLLFTHRFCNAILAPAGMMYVGKRISCTVNLKNRGDVNTVFTWGNPFGCHSRKIKVDVHPKSGKIEQREKLSLTICLTPLDEGIISHCYVPCFFCRSSEPVLLSIVGIIEKLNVTFEILNPEEKNKGNNSIFPPYGTALRIHWPVKVYDPNLGRSFISEVDVLEMKCQCYEAEKSANEAFENANQESALCTPKESLGPNQNSFRGKGAHTSKESSPGKAFRFPPPEESLFEASSCDSFTGGKKLAETNSVQKYGSHESLMDGLQLMKAELEFFNVTYHTPVVRKFVIRNETPVETKFRIQVRNFGKRPSDDENRIKAIKEKVFGQTKGDMWETKEPLILTVEPSEGELSGYDAVCVTVVASGNTWGEYRDCIVCQIEGIQAFNLKVFVQLVGHPFYFPMSENHTSEKPVLRFQPVTHLSEPASKQIRVVNRCSIPVTIAWLIFLTQPLLKEQEEQEESLNLCQDSNANIDSNHSEESTKSVKVYLPKNMSESSSTFRNMLEMRDFSQNSGTFESFGKGETPSEKNENREPTDREEKTRQDCIVPSVADEVRSENQPYLFRIDIHNFQVQPKEIFFEPFEEKRITVTFDPRFCKSKETCQEFRAVLTGCVKLSPEHEKWPELYYRPCGMNFLSEILDLNAVVETPVVSFEILKGDLRFFVDANDVIKSKSKKTTLSRAFFFKNNSQKSIPLKIQVSPGSIFSVSKVETIDEVHEKYDPEVNQLKVETGQLLQVQLECTVTYKGVIYAYEQLKISRRKEVKAVRSEEVNATKSTEDEETMGKRPADREQQQQQQQQQPWCRCFNDPSRVPTTTRTCSLEARDSFKINLNRMSSKSDGNICCDYSEGGCYPEGEGEYLDLPSATPDSPSRPTVFQHVIVVEEEISFLQPGLLSQTIVAELHLSFPALRLLPTSLDMGNVYIGETSVRYCSLINLTGTPTDFKAKSKCNINEFAVKPSTGNVPSANYNSDIGKTIAVEFRPRHPGYFVQVFQIYCNAAMEFDCHELTVTGNGTWNEKYKQIKFETGTRLPGIVPDL